MNENYNNEINREEQKITVEAMTIDGVADALGMEIVEDLPEEKPPEYPVELREVLETLADIYGGVKVATENDSRGRSRKMVRQYADREDLGSDEVGHILRVLEGHELVVQDGNRWRVADEP